MSCVRENGDLGTELGSVWILETDGLDAVRDQISDACG